MKLLTTLMLPSIARKLRKSGLTYLSVEKLESLVGCMMQVNRQNVAGNVMEMGLALGGSAILLASLMGERKFQGYDVFGQIPPPGDDDGSDAHKRYEVIKSGQSKGLKGDIYYGYRNDLYDEVQSNFSRFGYPVDGQRITLTQGLFEKTLKNFNTPVALAHIDCDWYDPVKLCLDRIGPHVSCGGFIVLDDYCDYQGCRRATDNFVKEAPFEIVKTAPHAVLVRR